MLVIGLQTVCSQASEGDNSQQNQAASSWLFSPLVSSDPKVSTSAGAIVGYLHRFDEHSPVSQFFAGGSYSVTQSYRYGLAWKTYFSQDRNRLTGGIVWGKVRNDFSDFLGSGRPVQTTDALKLMALRYTRKIADHWYLGTQFISTNYVITAENMLVGKVFDKIGLTGFTSNGVGLVIQYDSRNNQNSPTSGQFMQLHNIAYRKSFGGDASFDVYHLEYRKFHAIREHLIAVLHLQGRWSINAPPGGFSSVQLRGYVRGQNLAQHMILAEVEARYMLNGKWGCAAFAGIEKLYGRRLGLISVQEMFPAFGAGLIYQLNRERMVIRADIAVGKQGNRGMYINFGQPF